eukprot:179671_1
MLVGVVVVFCGMLYCALAEDPEEALYQSEMLKLQLERAKKENMKKKEKAEKKAEKITAKDPNAGASKEWKAANKEGGKKGQDVAGAADMGGLEFFCTSVDTPEGDWELLQVVMDAMNTPVAPDAEERRGGAGHVGKMLFSSGIDKLALMAYVPEDKQAKLSAAEWMKAVVATFEGEVLTGATAASAKGQAMLDQDKGRFPIKMKDLAIPAAIAYLKEKGVFPDKDDDDESDMVFGDDDFPCNDDDVAEAEAEAAAEPWTPEDAGSGKDWEKKVKASDKEGGKKGQDIAGAADMGGLEFFCSAVEQPEGNMALLQLTLTAMN